MAAAKRRYDDDANKANGWKMVIPYGHKLFRPRIAKHSPKLLIHDEERIPCWWMAVQKGALEMCVGATFTCDEETPWRMIAYKWPNHHTSFTKSTNCPAQLSSALRLLSVSMVLITVLYVYLPFRDVSLYRPYSRYKIRGDDQTRPDQTEANIYVESLIEQFQRLIN